MVGSASTRTNSYRAAQVGQREDSGSRSVMPLICGQTKVARKRLRAASSWEGARVASVPRRCYYAEAVQREPAISVHYSAEIWNGRETFDIKTTASAATEAEAIEAAKKWAKATFSHSKDKLLLRVTVAGKVQSFRSGNFDGYATRASWGIRALVVPKSFILFTMSSNTSSSTGFLR